MISRVIAIPYDIPSFHAQSGLHSPLDLVFLADITNPLLVAKIVLDNELVDLLDVESLGLLVAEVLDLLPLADELLLL